MRRRRDPVPRARAAGHWLAGIFLLGLLGGGVVSAAVLLWENLDVRQLAPSLAEDRGPLPLPEPPVAAASEERGFAAALLRSPRNAAFFPDRTYYSASLGRWRALLEDVGGRVRELASAEDLGALSADEVLVVPDAPCLSGGELAALRAHVRSGGGLVSNWAVGARDEECAWRGWTSIARLTGAPDVRELAVRDALYLTVPAGTPLSPGLDPGTRIELVPEPSLALTLEGARVYWSDWALNAAPDESGGGADAAALAYRTPAGGRGAWFGFRLSQSATPADSARMDRLVENGIRWVAGVATASVSPWPGGRRAALVLAQDLEAEYGRSLAMAELLRERDVRGSFFPVSRMVKDDKALAESLAATGEVGSQTSDHQPVVGLPLGEQSVRLRRSRAEIRDWTGVAPDGLKPPEEAFDENTLRAWGELGGTYVLAVNRSRSGSPELHRAGGRVLVVLPRLIKDDYNVFVQEGALRSERLTAAFLEGMDKMRAMGGLAVVASHTQVIGSGRHLEAVRAVIDTARSHGDWWIVPARDVARWWRARSAVRLAVQPVTHDGLQAASDSTAHDDARPGLRLLVQAPAEEGVNDLWVDLVLPAAGGRLAPVVDGEPVSYVGTEWGLRVPVGDIPAGGRRTVTLVPTA